MFPKTNEREQHRRRRNKLNLILLPKSMSQGLKAAFILRPLRHDSSRALTQNNLRLLR
jgi:hypothetical protein